MTKLHPTLLNPRAAGKFISENSQHVSIDDARIKTTATKLVASFRNGKYSLEGWKKEVLHPNIANEAAIDFIFLTDTLNFSFWPDSPNKKFTVTYNGESYVGYWSLVAALRRAQDEGIDVTSAHFMAAANEDKVNKIFRSSNGTTVPLLQDRVKAMNEAGRVLLEKFDGSFVSCVRSCAKDALVLLDTIVDNFSSFRDVTQFEGKTVAFYKRAQILIADIWACFEGKDLGEFHNIEALTMFADYRVPQTLEYFGILCYSKQLKKMLQDGVLMEKGSRYEVEIRGCSIDAVERLKGSILSAMSNDATSLVNSITVDFFLWDYARSHRAQMQHLPYHRVRTKFY